MSDIIIMAREIVNLFRSSTNLYLFSYLLFILLTYANSEKNNDQNLVPRNNSNLHDVGSLKKNGNNSFEIRSKLQLSRTINGTNVLENSIILARNDDSSELNSLVNGCLGAKESTVSLRCNRNNRVSHKEAHQLTGKYRLKRTVLAEMTVKPQFGELGNTAKLTRRNTTLKESKIAAIFRGVAYGSPFDGLNEEISKDIKNKKEVMKMPTISVNSEKLSEIDSESNSVKSPSNYIKKSTSVTPSVKIKSNNIILENILKTKENNNEQSTEQVISNSETKYKERNATVNSYVSPTTRPGIIKHLPKPTTIHDEYILKTENRFSVHTETKTISKNTTIKNDWEDVKKILGTAWRIYVLSATCAFGGITIISVYILCRGKVWHDISPTLFILFHVSLISTTLSRATCYFIEALNPKTIPSVTIMLILWNISFPLIASMLALFLFVLLKTSPFKLLCLPPLGVLVTCIIHIILYIGVDIFNEMEENNVAGDRRQLSVDIFSTIWGILICVCHIYLLIKIENKYINNTKLSSDVTNSPPRLRKAARLSTISVCCLVILSCMAVFPHLMRIHSPPLIAHVGNIWGWFTLQVITRLTELILCVFILLSSSALVHYKQGDCPPTQGKSLCSIFAKCCMNTKSSNVHPISKRTQPLAIFTLHKQRSSYDYATNDFQLVWNNSRANDNAVESLPEYEDKDTITPARPAVRNLKPMKFLPNNCRSNDSVFTPSPDEHYHSPLSKSTTGLYDNIQIEQISSKQTPSYKPYFPSKTFYVDNYKYLGSTLPNRSSNLGGEEIANVSRPPALDTPSYWAPHMTSQRFSNNTHEILNDKTAHVFHSLDYLSPLDSTERVFGDASGSDGRHEITSLVNTLSRTEDEDPVRIFKKTSSLSTREGANRSGRGGGLWQPVHTLPYKFSSSPRRFDQEFDNNRDARQSFYQIAE